MTSLNPLQARVKQFQGRYSYQLKLMRPLAPPPPLAPPRGTEENWIVLFSGICGGNAPSNNDAGRTKTCAGEAIPVAGKSVINSVLLIVFFE
jgi:hypothetical protein